VGGSSAVASRPAQVRHVQRNSPRRRGEGCLKAVTCAADVNSLTGVRSVRGSVRASKNHESLGLRGFARVSPRGGGGRHLAPAGARSGLAAHKLSAKRAFEGLARWRADRRVQVSRCSPWPWRPPSRQASSRQGEARLKAGPLCTIGEAITAAADPRGRYSLRSLARRGQPRARRGPVRPSPVNVARCPTASRRDLGTVTVASRGLDSVSTPGRGKSVAKGGRGRSAQDSGVQCHRSPETAGI
jgi:hypothetical protein